MEDYFIYYRVCNVSKKYGNNLVVKNVNITFPSTGLVALVGKSGSGKSTLLNMLTGIDKPSSGHIFYGDKEITRFTARELKTYQNQEIGILFQHFNLFEELSSIENVIMPCLIKGESRSGAIKKATTLFEQYQLTPLMHQSFKTLSGGEKQRVALLRALINEPKIILADEPTGALDSKNSVLIMAELKKLAANHLVIVVSHNEELIKQYEDIRINIVEGKVKAPYYKNTNRYLLKAHRNHTNKSLLKMFMKIHLKAHKVRNFIVGGAISFAVLCLMLSLGYINGSKASIARYKSESLQYNYATIAKKTIIDIPNSPIKISKLTRPDLSSLDFLEGEMKSVIIANNYHIAFPITPTFIFNEKEINDVEFAPVYDFKPYAPLITAGTLPHDNFIEVVVNEEFVKHFDYQNQNMIKQGLQLSHTSTIHTKTTINSAISDFIVFHHQIQIVGVVREFGYLNTPRIYYSYRGLENILMNETLENYSRAIGQNRSVVDIINEASNDEANSGYCYNLFINNLEEVDILYQLKEKHDQLNDFDISSNSYLVTNSYQSMTDIISTSLIVFITMTILAAVSIVIITAYANYTQNKKESAILSILGSKRGSVFHIFNFENILIALLSIIFAFILCFPFEAMANNLVANIFHLNHLISVPVFSFLSLLVIVVTIVLVTLATFIPFIFYEKGYILEELKDE